MVMAEVIRNYYLLVVMEQGEENHNCFHSIVTSWSQNLVKDWLRGLILQRMMFHSEFEDYHS